MKSRGIFTKSEWGLLILTAIFLCLLFALLSRELPGPSQADYSIVIRSEMTEVTPEPEGPLNINTADAEQLDTLYGIGPVLAERIIQYRQENGPFTSVEELLEVKGIGTSILEEIEDLITTEEEQK